MCLAPDLSAKRLDILRTLDPRIARFAILWDSSNPGLAKRVAETKIAADRSHVLLHPVGPRNSDELDAALAELLKARPDALLVTAEAFTRRYLARIVEFATRNRIPTMFEDSVYVEAGGLMSYGPDYQDVFQKAAIFVDRHRLEASADRARMGPRDQIVFDHACRIGLEGIVSKRRDLPYRSGRSKCWIKVKNPSSPAMLRIQDGTF